MTTELDYIRIVLCQPSHPGNIGACARAMKNMGLSKLYLVNPETFPSDHAIARAAGADEILAQAQVVDSLSKAIKGCKLVIGTSARARNLPQQLSTPRNIAIEIMQYAEQQQPIAIVFGHERNGLSNDELGQCHKHVSIPCNPNYSSLNLAASVQVIAYECYLAWLDRQSCTENEQSHDKCYDKLASADAMEGFYQHLAETLANIDFLNPLFPKRTMPRIRRLCKRAEIEGTELNILRGILTAINRQVKATKQ